MPSDGGAWKELLRAAGENNSSLVAFLLSHNIDPNFQHPEYFTSPLFEAIRAGHLTMCQQLVDAGASLTIPEDLTGSTPLELALEEKQHAIVDFLLERLTPDHIKGYIMTILVTSVPVLDTQLLQQLAFTGHNIWIDACGMDADEGELVVKELQLATKNTKIQLVASVESPKWEAVTHWVIREDEENMPLLPHMTKYFSPAPMLPQLKRAMIITSKPMSAELGWLLAHNSKTTAMVEPTSWWDTFGDFAWSRTREQTLWWLLTTFDSVEGRLYNYKRNVVADSSDAASPGDQLVEDEWNIKFKPLVS
jgi:hypothetical protein